MKQAFFVIAGSLVGTISFAQVNLGVTNTTNAAVQKSVNVGGATRSATSAAARESYHPEYP